MRRCTSDNIVLCGFFFFCGEFFVCFLFVCFIVCFFVCLLFVFAFGVGFLVFLFLGLFVYFILLLGDFTSSIATLLGTKKADECGPNKIQECVSPE